MVGEELGPLEGLAVGLVVGFRVGALEGDELGALLGDADGFAVGLAVGDLLGGFVGLDVIRPRLAERIRSQKQKRKGSCISEWAYVYGM